MKDEAIAANAEKAFKELSEKLEHRELITKEEARKSRQFILDECNKGAGDQIIGACSGVNRKLQAMSFYLAFLVRLCSR